MKWISDPNIEVTPFRFAKDDVPLFCYKSVVYTNGLEPEKRLDDNQVKLSCK